ncbi:unnamed protein product [marine sediment metagenome]|uniref:Uncharacterized protein n=1 Tax=marine sediment metagenome TaxID=412755 RepID=X1A221_9ZZZZ
MKLNQKKRFKAKQNKRQKEREKIFNCFMEENSPIAYKLNKMGHKIEKK